MKNLLFKFVILSLVTLVCFSCSSEKEIAKTIPQLSTNSAINITLTTATSGGNITTDGGAAVTARGLVWNTVTQPTVSLATKTTDGSGIGDFPSAITNLTPSTNYYARAYATNSVGTGYGNEITFTTGAVVLPTLTTTIVSGITTNSAISGGAITNDGGAAVTARGLVWNTATAPTTSLATKTTDGSGIGDFPSAITNLTPSTNYYARAYATNSVGTGYGNEITFTTGAVVLPTLTTTVVSGITTNSAISGGTINNDGGGTITARGVVWSTTQNPTITLTTKTNDGVNTGTYTSNLTNLAPNTTYFIRSYATNSAGTSYGNQLSFTTSTINYAAMYPTGTVFCNNVVTAVVDVTNPITGKTWMDRNLGATQVAISATDVLAYGDLYQWGRRSDGHQCRNSRTTTNLSSVVQVQHGDFILNPGNSGFIDWLQQPNNNLWQEPNQLNNPCPIGYRLPTFSELNEERNSWSRKDIIGAFQSLKLTLGFARSNFNGDLVGGNTQSTYWSSTVTIVGNGSYGLRISNNNSDINPGSRVIGLNIRCIKK
jgi:hypothetical protein